MDFSMNNRERIEELNTLIKIGEVSSVDYARGTARVVFDDDDGLVSYDLPVLQHNTLHNKDYAMPDVGEDVVCVFLPSGGEEGFILGSIYAGEITPPESNGDKRAVEFKDGTKISYDRASHELTAEIEGTKIVANRETVDITGKSTVNIEGATAINLKGAVVNLTMGGTSMTLNNGNAVIDTKNITFTGDMKVTGDLDVVGKINATGTVHGSNI